MSRIERAFERRFRELLDELGARDRAKGLRWLLACGRTVPPEARARAWIEANIALAQKVRRFRRRRGLPKRVGCPVFCDAGLGGLARWLRAAGCDAHWVRDIEDAELVACAEALEATIITTDSLLLDRRPITQGRVRALWVPPTLTILEQFRLLRAELDLPENDSRCMRCGGELIPVPKEAVRDRIPPRTYRWLEEYFECSRCHQLFWEGTHWQRVTRRLTTV